MKQIAAAAFLMAVSALAHHSFRATYLLDQQMTIEGKVSKFLLRNPHSFLEVDVLDAAGHVETWSLEWGNGAALVTRGLKRNALMPGDVVTITISPGHIPGEHRGLLRVIRRASDGFEWGTKPGEVPMEWGPAK